MSFPSNVKEDALTACARHCCICHKFCGIKIELHHIKPKGDGGSDTFNNCIPLCFDCHAEMSSYDFKHPKGTKYTETELKRHRDSWYGKVKGSPGIVPLPENMELDRAIFRRIKELLPWSGPISFVRNHHFGSSFELDNLTEFHRFVRECEDPSFEFIDADLEGARANLLESIVTFTGVIALQTFPTGIRRTNAVPEEWEYKQPERYKKVIGQLNQGSTKIVECYDLLIKLGRRKLSIE